ncbi:MAG TPA: type IV secretion system protein [Rhodanobacter sp.]|nr:type IV secretion system protein [Rhodanobacter sp.]
MLNKKSSAQKIDDSIARSINFELTIADLARRSERRAWWVAFSAIVVALILAGGYFYMLPLKEKVPYIVMADAYTGTSTVARLTEDFTNRHISTSEAINRSNVAHFVLARESYDVAMMNLHDWTTTLTMSSPGVAAAYTTLYSTNNPESPYKTYGRERAIRVKILSIVLIGGGPNLTPKGATVRFQRSLYDKQTGVTRPMDSKLATMEFVYKTNLKMDDQNRIENPLGFQVTSYRVDADYDATPPGEIAGASLPSADAAGAGQTAPNAQTPQAPGASADALPPASAELPPTIPPQPPIPEHENPQAAGAAAPAPRNTANGVGHR